METAYKDETDLSILIVNWNSGDFLRRCLESLEKQRDEGVSFEVIVVDNASVDDSMDGIEERFPWVKVIRNTYNYGFAKATNQAYRLSKGRYVMTLNPDTYLPSGTLKQIVQFLDDTPEAGAVQPCPDTYYTTYYVGEVRFLFAKLLLNKLFPSQTSQPISEPLDVPWLWGTGIVIRRSALENGIFYKEWAFLFCEEYDMCKMMHKKGYKLFILPTRMDHFRGGSRKKSSEIKYLTLKLSNAAIYVMEYREVGMLRARLNAFIKFIDGFLLWSSQCVLQLIKPKKERVDSLIDWKARWVANLALLFMGSAYFQKVNQKTEKILNDQQLIRQWLYSSSKQLRLGAVSQ